MNIKWTHDWIRQCINYLDDMHITPIQFPALAESPRNMPSKVHSTLPGLETALINIWRNVIGRKTDCLAPLIREIIFGHQLRSYIKKLAPR